MNDLLNQESYKKLKPLAQLNISHNLSYPEKVLQFGTGNFLRGYADWMIDKLNDSCSFKGRVVLVQSSLSDAADQLNQQDGLYTVIERDQSGEVFHLITSISRVLIAQKAWHDLIELACDKNIQLVISNTTEAGLVYEKETYSKELCPNSYPGKLTHLLYQRFKRLGIEDPWVICPMELIEDNGQKLKKIVLQHASDWDLEQTFIDYINQDCEFCDTLVDRIVSGFPSGDEEKYHNKLGYRDQKMVVIEPYHQLAIQNYNKFKRLLPLHEYNFNVQYTDDLKLYRDAKVSFLNGAHTSMCAISLLSSCDTVMETMENEDLRRVLDSILSHEILPCVELPKLERIAYLESVIKRFSNPHLKHRWKDISLNSISKWKVRVLPNLKKYWQLHQTLPKGLCFSLAALLAYYVISLEDNQELRDGFEVIDIITKEWNRNKSKFIENILSSRSLWGDNLLLVPGLLTQVEHDFKIIKTKGIKPSIKKLIEV